MISPQRRQEILYALRRGTVPQRGLDAFAVGTERFERMLDEDLGYVAGGNAGFKAIRGEYGSGKTFTVRWMCERARSHGFATAEVQISEGETPLHHLETVYRRLCERLSTSDSPEAALRSIVDSWFYALHEDVLSAGGVDSADAAAVLTATEALAEQRLRGVAGRAPALASVLRGYRRAMAAGDAATAEGLLAWLGGQPHVAASIKSRAGITGTLDHDGALGFLAGLLTILRGAGYSGLVLVLDEVETLQRVRSDVRDRALNALRQIIDEIDQGRFPGLYVVITGTPAFFDGPQGAQRLAPLAQRLHVDFPAELRFDSVRAVQVRLPGFGHEQLDQVGRRIRDLFAEGSGRAAAVRAMVDDEYVSLLARAITGELGGKVGLAPRVFLRKLIAVLDQVDEHEGYDPRRHYALTVSDGELNEVERNALAASSVDEIDLDLGPGS